MKGKIQNGNWWNDVSVKHSVVLADFKNQLEVSQKAGIPINKFVYNVAVRLDVLKAKNHVNV